MKNSSSIIIGKDEYRVLFTEERIRARVSEIAMCICGNYQNAKQPPILLLVLTGGLYFGTDLSKMLDSIGFVHHLDTVGLKSYSSDEKGGAVEIISRPHADLGGRDIIVVEDVIDRGHTMNFLDRYLKSLSSPPQSISYCALLVKNNHGPLDFQIKYHGFTIGPEWIVGYGMDSNQGYRGLSSIYVKE